MIDQNINTTQLRQDFSKSLVEFDRKTTASLLHENGQFDIQDNNLETMEVGKDKFMKWISEKLFQSKITSVGFDQCLHCKIGNDVLLINEGQFPRKIKDISERSKTGLMLDYKDGLIINIKFCFVFAETENKCMFELNHFGNE